MLAENKRIKDETRTWVHIGLFVGIMHDYAILGG